MNMKNMKSEITPKYMEIWFADLPLDQNSRKTGGNRPVAIVSNNAFNRSSNMIAAIPISSKLRRLDLPTHVVLDNMFLDKKSIALCEQLCTLDRSQLQFKIGFVSETEQQAIQDAIKIQLALVS